ncbi:hypothetical protein OE749_03025 [Aestuariibacter sp. AA17]|uniref:Uncharacterized protein n=1 Tax=Fluctibacter corallii TaxID=2984329 RepID=A0ABT3A4T7_9ALTE|nr:hypothetical protein [Aestuariibacter sp. AA17]MCV2883673.1 hypothetical protein [Aestuariibacter sp. AA17]
MRKFSPHTLLIKTIITLNIIAAMAAMGSVVFTLYDAAVLTYEGVGFAVAHVAAAVVLCKRYILGLRLTFVMFLVQVCQFSYGALTYSLQSGLMVNIILQFDDMGGFVSINLLAIMVTLFCAISMSKLRSQRNEENVV